MFYPSPINTQGLQQSYDQGQRDFCAIDLRSMDLSGLILRGINFTQAQLHNTNLSLVDGQDSNLTAATFSKAMLWRANLQRSQLAHSCGDRAILIRADLSCAHCHQINLPQADLRLANLHLADFTQANLTGANLSYADLTGANLTGANLSHANLTGANLTGANLHQTQLQRAILTNVIGLHPANLQLAKANPAAELNRERALSALAAMNLATRQAN